MANPQVTRTYEGDQIRLFKGNQIDMASPIKNNVTAMLFENLNESVESSGFELVMSIPIMVPISVCATAGNVLNSPSGSMGLL